MEIFIPNGIAQSWQERVEEMKNLPLNEPFSPIVLSFLNDLSKKILKDTTLRRLPELVATGYWLRKAQINDIKKRFDNLKGDKLLLPRGVVLHFAPSNVDSIFIYSWVLSMLAGNKNIIRISRQQNEQIQILLEIIGELLEDKKYTSIAAQTLVLSYEHSEEISSFLSSHCHTRVIWGGDETVKAIRAIPLVPLATELVFADRFSSIAFNVKAVITASEEEMQKLFHSFYNDAYWFQQMACSSPKCVYWIGDQTIVTEAQKRFWNGFQNYLIENETDLPPALSMIRKSTSYYYAAHSYTEKITTNFQSNRPIKIQVKEVTDHMREMHCGAGLFFEVSVKELRGLSNFITDKEQTLSYYGFTKMQLAEWVYSVPGRGIDRIVPVGQALSFHDIWDGYNLLLYFTREVNIQ
ncbi:MAG: acyl-CoA reductase [Bacillaceae bacterium]|nr:acyl-CoA reductase [Bacillaceae bacterium]